MDAHSDRDDGMAGRPWLDQGHAALYWEIDAARSSLTFSLHHLVSHEIRGRFMRWGGRVFIDLRQPWLSSAAVWVDLTSIDTGNPERDDQVRSAEFLDVVKFPQAHFQSTAVAMHGDAVTLEGRLEVHGVSRDVEIDVKLVGPVTTGRDGRGRLQCLVRGAIDRQSFGLHWNQDLKTGGVVVSDEVEIAAQIALVEIDERAVR